MWETNGVGSVETLEWQKWLQSGYTFDKLKQMSADEVSIVLFEFDGDVKHCEGLAFGAVMRFGCILWRYKEAVGHGNFETFMEKHFPNMSKNTYNRRMRCFSKWSDKPVETWPPNQKEALGTPKAKPKKNEPFTTTESLNAALNKQNGNETATCNDTTTSNESTEPDPEEHVKLKELSAASITKAIKKAVKEAVKQAENRFEDEHAHEVKELQERIDELHEEAKQGVPEQMRELFEKTPPRLIIVKPHEVGPLVGAATIMVNGEVVHITATQPVLLVLRVPQVANVAA